MNTVTDGLVVSIAYTLKSASGDVFDHQTEPPVHYLHGSNGLVPGLERALTGRSVGETFTVELSPEDGFGIRSDESTRTFPRDILVDDLPIKVGTPIFSDIFEGVSNTQWVTKVNDTSFTVDVNHPLAGQHVTFEVTVVAIRAATEAELADGFANV